MKTADSLLHTLSLLLITRVFKSLINKSCVSLCFGIYLLRKEVPMLIFFIIAQNWTILWTDYAAAKQTFSPNSAKFFSQTCTILQSLSCSLKHRLQSRAKLCVRGFEHAQTYKRQMYFPWHTCHMKLWFFEDTIQRIRIT